MGIPPNVQAAYEQLYQDRQLEQPLDKEEDSLSKELAQLNQQLQNPNLTPEDRKDIEGFIAQIKLAMGNLDQELSPIQADEKEQEAIIQAAGYPIPPSLKA